MGSLWLRFVHAAMWGLAAFRTPGLTNLVMSGLAERIVQTIEQASETGEAKMFYVGDVKTDDRMLTIWCGIGNETPFARIEELNRQIAYLKRTRNLPTTPTGDET